MRLKQNLEITGLQKSTVSSRQQNVRKAVERDLEVLDSFLTDSYSRSTMIAPLKEADVDICAGRDAAECVGVGGGIGISGSSAPGTTSTCA